MLIRYNRKQIRNRTDLVFPVKNKKLELPQNQIVENTTVKNTVKESGSIEPPVTETTVLMATVDNKPPKTPKNNNRNKKTVNELG